MSAARRTELPGTGAAVHHGPVGGDAARYDDVPRLPAVLLRGKQWAHGSCGLQGLSRDRSQSPGLASQPSLTRVLQRGHGLRAAVRSAGEGPLVGARCRSGRVRSNPRSGWYRSGWYRSAWYRSGWYPGSIRPRRRRSLHAIPVPLCVKDAVSAPGVCAGACRRKPRSSGGALSTLTAPARRRGGWPAQAARAVRAGRWAGRWAGSVTDAGSGCRWSEVPMTAGVQVGRAGVRRRPRVPSRTAPTPSLRQAPVGFDGRSDISGALGVGDELAVEDVGEPPLH